MAYFACTYTIKLLSSKTIREAFFKFFPQKCNELNCTCEIDVKTKWWWFFDVYTIEVVGKISDVNEIEKLLKGLTKIH